MTRNVCSDCEQHRAPIYLDITTGARACAHRPTQEVHS